MVILAMEVPCQAGSSIFVLFFLVRVPYSCSFCSLRSGFFVGFGVYYGKDMYTCAAACPVCESNSTLMSANQLVMSMHRHACDGMLCLSENGMDTFRSSQSCFARVLHFAVTNSLSVAFLMSCRCQVIAFI